MGAFEWWSLDGGLWMEVFDGGLWMGAIGGLLMRTFGSSN